jgi:hypothetical protein
MKDIKELITNLKKSINENKSQKEINLNLVQIIEILSEPSLKSIQISEKPLTIFEFLKKRNVTQNFDIILNIAYYNENFRGISSFNSDDIKKQYEEARLKPPKNINDYLAKLESQKELIIACKEKKDEKKTWKLSSSGITYVESLVK